MLDQLTNKWIEIDMGAITSNLQAINSLIDEKVRLIAVLKANAYGHGAAEVARLLSRQGVDFFAVSFLQEGLYLRKSGIAGNILLFCPVVSEAEVITALENHLTLTIASPFDAGLISQTCARLDRPVTVHLKADTGLGRFGMSAEEIIQVGQELKANSRIYIEGIYTHMAAAMTNPGYTEKQFNKFKHIVELLEQSGCHIPIRHCANSAVLLKYPHMHLDAVRVGTLLSGQVPVGIPDHKLDLIDPYKFKSRVISLRRLPAGSRLGYFCTYRLRREALVAVIPVGFQDGLALQVANKPSGFIDLLRHLTKMILGFLNWSRFNLNVSIKGQLYPVRGKVFMQMALIELPPEADVRVGDEVEVPVRKTLASPALLRVYRQDGTTVRYDGGAALLEEG